MSIHILIKKLQHAGIGFELSATGLKVVAAPGIVTPALLAEIKENKPGLMAALSRTTPPKAEPVSCFSCGHYDGKGTAWPGTVSLF